MQKNNNTNKKNTFIINLRNTPSGYIVENDPFQIKKTTRPTNKTDLMIPSFNNDRTLQKFNDGLKNNFSIPFLAPNTTTIIPPQHTTIPISASWFDVNNIHEIQRQALPQFFRKNNSSSSNIFSKSQKLYKYYRNTMISMWKQNTKKYLAPSTCRKSLMGDACAIMRVHAFLQDWGIINFPSKQNKGISINKDIRVQCGICSNKHVVFYVNSSFETLFQICQECYNNEIYPIVLKKQEFKRIDLRQQTEQKWTQSQTLKLIQCITNYKQNWNQIAKHFPNKSKEALIYHFLRLPSEKITNISIFENGQDTSNGVKQNKYGSIFEDYRNPIQSSVAIINGIYKGYEQHKGKQQMGIVRQIMQASYKHAQYLCNNEEQKIDKIIKMMIDFTMNKVQSKLVFLHEFGTLINAQSEFIEQSIGNQVCEILKQANINIMKNEKQREYILQQ